MALSIPSTMVEQVSNIKDLEISYRVLHPTVVIHDVNTDRNIQIPFSSLTDKYRDFLSTITVTIELDDINMTKYRYRPKMVSEELYGTTEFWNDILILNKCKSVSEFYPRKLTVYDPDKFKAYINEIMILEGVVN